jgi:hypothetical protein
MGEAIAQRPLRQPNTVDEAHSSQKGATARELKAHPGSWGLRGAW